MDISLKIIGTYALAGIACAIPGNYLLLRKQSMMGDALSHTSLLGIILAFLGVGWASQLVEGQTPESQAAWLQGAMYFGAIITGVIAAFLTESIHRLGRVESSAALGVVFTTMFAAGLLLMRLVDTAHIDLDCVLYGSIVNVVYDEFSLGSFQVPRGILFNGIIVLANLFIVMLFYKELAVTAFDSQLATALGIHSTNIRYALMSLTAVTIVTVFESVGSILVIAMLIVPPATAYLLTVRLDRMILISMGVAGMSAVCGYQFARAIPNWILPSIGFEASADANIAGMMAASSGAIFTVALFFSPQQGLVRRWANHFLLKFEVACDDLLGLMYRLEEWNIDERTELARRLIQEQHGYSALTTWFALERLVRKGTLSRTTQGFSLTPQGSQIAKGLVRAHRLWEAYMDKHFSLPSERLHESAHRIEHYLDPELREDLSQELHRPQLDPHGRKIPEE